MARSWRGQYDAPEAERVASWASQRTAFCQRIKDLRRVDSTGIRRGLKFSTDSSPDEFEEAFDDAVDLVGVQSTDPSAEPVLRLNPVRPASD